MLNNPHRSSVRRRGSESGGGEAMCDVADDVDELMMIWSTRIHGMTVSVIVRRPRTKLYKLVLFNTILINTAYRRSRSPPFRTTGPSTSSSRTSFPAIPRRHQHRTSIAACSPLPRSTTRCCCHRPPHILCRKRGSSRSATGSPREAEQRLP